MTAMWRDALVYFAVWGFTGAVPAFCIGFFGWLWITRRRDNP